MTKKNTTKNLNQIKEELKKTVGTNIKKLCIAMEWSQGKMADKIGISDAALSNYIKAERLADLDVLVKICSLPDIKRKGFNVKVDDFLSNSHEFTNTQVIENSVTSQESPRNDFIGNYICYFYAQSKSVHNQDSKTPRELRFGILSVYDEYNCITGESKIKALAFFYKEKDLEDARNAKRRLDEIFGEHKTIADRNQAIIDFVSSLPGNTGIYDGDIVFTKQHTFVNIRSAIYNDTALMIFYLPNKREQSDYLGGIGSIASVAHGRMHMPTAQKIIISRHELGCSFEEIADHLSLASAPVEQTEETVALAEICKRLYSSDDQMSLLIDDGDKIAIVKNRLNQLVRNYIEKNVCCVGSVSDEEDAKIYTLIKKYMD